MDLDRINLDMRLMQVRGGRGGLMQVGGGPGAGSCLVWEGVLDWLDWSVGWLVGRSAGWLDGWLVGWVDGWVVSWLVGCAP